MPEFGDDEIWRAVGNGELVESERIVALRISRQVPETLLPGVVAMCLRGAREKGYVYASTFYSPGERAVFGALAQETGAAMIRLMPTFMELAYRPHGDEPRLFAAKRLLVMSRMNDPEEPPRRGELLELNDLCGKLAKASKEGRVVYVKMVDGMLVYEMPAPVPARKGLGVKWVEV